jgi:hypothetical protein
MIEPVPQADPVSEAHPGDCLFEDFGLQLRQKLHLVLQPLLPPEAVATQYYVAIYSDIKSRIFLKQA